MPTAGVAKCDERRQKAFVCTAQCWVATLSAPTCSGVSYISTGSAMFHPAGAKIEFCLRLTLLQWGRAGNSPSLAHWIPHTEPSHCNHRCLCHRVPGLSGSHSGLQNVITGLSKPGSKFVQVPPCPDSPCSALPDVQLLPVVPFHAHIWAGNAEHPSERSVGRICSLILAYCSFLCSPLIHTCLKLCLKDTGSGRICLGIRPSSFSQATWNPVIHISGAPRERSQSLLPTAQHCQRR